jgi:hypothetical protein
MIFGCPLYAPLRLKHSELFPDAPNLSSVCQSALAARFIYDCFLMHATFVAEVQIWDLSYSIESSLAPPLDGNKYIHSKVVSHSKPVLGT